MSTLRTFTSYGRGAGSARVRVFDWLDYLSLDATSETYLGTSNNSGRTLATHPWGVVQAEWRLRAATRNIADATTLISRQASPLSAGRLEATLLSKAARGIYDFDDALGLSPAGGTASLSSKQRVWTNSVRAADIVIAGNANLAEQALRLNDNVVIIPSCVDPAQYERKTTYEISRVPRALWIGSPSTESYLKTISTSLLALHASHGLRLTVISAGDASLGALDIMIDRKDWSPHGFGDDIRQADFGVMPLVDNEWARGKCAYKLLQYGAAGLPMIGSPVGANAEVLTHAGAGAPSTTDEWIAEMERMIDASPDSRAAQGELALHTVAEKYSFSAWAPTWARTVGVAAPRE
ncbi:hypothetical protein [Salinibacterium sp. M195]|uniref:hypothetical protein n=1 Tax=Salinibacterium sp. M195 TaxID=2583374 RepID=UPI001C62E818|nr:hypothetical protein [Salinibacterium sp. M195]QYH34846.1 glycosyltransferase family 4 protein [Salinibacterium sp. M195]